MTYKDYQKSRDAAWDILLRTNADALPISLNVVCAELGVRAISYHDAAQTPEAAEWVDVIRHTDGLTFYVGGDPVILFDETKPAPRRRFTVAHEIGHLILGHVLPGTCTVSNREPSPADRPEETAANTFAARLLAPACVLWGLDLHTAEEIAAACNISLAAARFRADRMAELYRRQRFLTSPLERQVYERFLPFIRRYRMTHPADVR